VYEAGPHPRITIFHLMQERNVSAQRVVQKALQLADFAALMQYIACGLCILFIRISRGCSRDRRMI
jgi:hypothetical protein